MAAASPPAAAGEAPTLVALCVDAIAAQLPRFCIRAGDSPSAVEVRGGAGARGARALVAPRF